MTDTYLARRRRVRIIFWTPITLAAFASIIVSLITLY